MYLNCLPLWNSGLKFLAADVFSIKYVVNASNIKNNIIFLLAIDIQTFPGKILHKKRKSDFYYKVHYLKQFIWLLKGQRYLKTLVYIANGEKYETIEDKHSLFFFTFLVLSILLSFSFSLFNKISFPKV